MFDYLDWDSISGAAAWWLNDLSPMLILVAGIVIAVVLVGIGIALISGDRSDFASVGSGAPLVDNRVK